MSSLDLRKAALRVVLVAGSTLLFAACDRSPTDPGTLRPTAAARRDSTLTCRSGYVIVDGRQVCPDT
jgi:uncharacterized lipoprotein YajG